MFISQAGKPDMLSFKRFYSLVCGVLFLFSLLACVPQRQSQDSTNVDALLWSTASAEYEIIARQIFFQAQRQLDRMLEQKSETAALEQEGSFSKLPPAIIVEVDETILSNGAFQYQLISRGEAFDEETNWAQWVNQASSKAIPGAVEYTRHAADKGITVFYITNRDVSLMDGTWRNLRQSGFPLVENKHQLLMRNANDGWGWDKSSRRAFVAKNYHVIQIVGDGLGDFMGNTETLSPMERRDLSSRYMAYWGEKWFMLPNPIYGDWENAILNAGKVNDSNYEGNSANAKYRFIRGGESQGVW